MANLTLSIEDELLKRARIRALNAGTSVNAMVREYLASIAPDPQDEILSELSQLADTSNASSGSAGRTWTRDELHER